MKRRLAAGVEANDLSSELLLYDSGRDSVHVLNSTGRIILNAFLDGRTLEEIEGLLKKTYAYEAGRDLKEEINRFLEDLEAKNLIEPPR